MYVHVITCIICIIFIITDEINFEDLLTDLLDVMYLYQRLCPSLLAQANFTISKIITDYKHGKDDVNSFLKLSPSLLSSTLCLLLEAPIDSLRSLIQVST